MQGVAQKPEYPRGGCKIKNAPHLRGLHSAASGKILPKSSPIHTVNFCVDGAENNQPLWLVRTLNLTVCMRVGFYKIFLLAVHSNVERSNVQRSNVEHSNVQPHFPELIRAQ